MLAFAALALNQIAASSVYQGVAVVLIALVMIRVSLRLISRSHDFLVGVDRSTSCHRRGDDLRVARSSSRCRCRDRRDTGNGATTMRYALQMHYREPGEGEISEEAISEAKQAFGAYGRALEHWRRTPR